MNKTYLKTWSALATILVLASGCTQMLWSKGCSHLGGTGSCNTLYKTELVSKKTDTDKITALAVSRSGNGKTILVGKKYWYVLSDEAAGQWQALSEAGALEGLLAGKGLDVRHDTTVRGGIWRASIALPEGDKNGAAYRILKQYYERQDEKIWYIGLEKVYRAPEQNRAESKSGLNIPVRMYEYGSKTRVSKSRLAGNVLMTPFALVTDAVLLPVLMISK